jgi:hypothetical protein
MEENYSGERVLEGKALAFRMMARDAMPRHRDT